MPEVAAVPSSTVQHLADSILDPQRHIEGERRNISVVFVDVRSFTPFSESLDPEEVYEAVDVFLRALVEQVQQFGGHVDKFTGDGLMALFGAPVAHENDPERAVRAAWGMQQALRQLAETESWSAPVALNARIGVNTGMVVVADVGADVNYTAMGDVVNVAARLEQNAEPGGVLVSASTYEFTHPFFEFEAIGPLQVKGRQEPIETFKVVGEKARPGTLRGARGLRAPLVGREAELARLRSIAAALTDTGQGSLVILTGEAGIGKSRLTAELRSSLEQTPVTFLVGEAVSYGRSAAYEVFARILRRFFRIEPGAAPNTARERLRALLAALDPDLNTSAQVYIENLIGLPLTEPDARRLARLEPQQLRQQTFLAIRTLLSAAAAVEPVVLVFEDLHWIDELSLELLLFLLKSVEQNALLLYGTTRPDEGVALQRIDEMARAELGQRYQRIELEPLSRQDSRSLITSLLDLPSLPAHLSALITEKAEGNPFFTEELIGVLIDRGIVEPAGDGWQLRPDVDYSEFDVPLTLDGLIMARVDSMGPQARQVLQHAAVIGRRFELPLLRQLLNGVGAALADMIVLMEERGFITPLPAAATKAYEFRHGLMPDSVYNSLLFRKRRELHGLAAAAIETIQPQRPEDEPELLAFHYSRSDTPQRALPYTISAGHRARRRFANHEAVDYYNQALTLLADDADASVERRLEVFTGLGEVQDFSGEYEAAVTSYKQALAVLKSTGVSSGETVADVQRRLGRVYERWGDYTQAMRWLDTGLSALDQAQAAEDNAHRALIYKDNGMLLFRQ
ncbi:MAG: AAA family ATPase, partial [Anaerolineales bacterium]